MCDFEAGDQVLCIGWDNAPALPGQIEVETSFEKGRPYCVKQVLPPDFTGDVWGVRFTDYPDPDPVDGDEPCWDARGFRRVYRPDGSLIGKLLEPVDLGAEV